MAKYVIVDRVTSPPTVRGRADNSPFGSRIEVKQAIKLYANLYVELSKLAGKPVSEDKILKLLHAHKISE
jgi:hypothetical protein